MNDNLSGVWWATVDFGSETAPRRMVLRADGDRLAGTVWGRTFEDGTIDGGAIRFETADASRVYRWSAVLDGDQLVGEINYEGGKATWTAIQRKPFNAVEEE